MSGIMTSISRLLTSKTSRIAPLAAFALVVCGVFSSCQTINFSRRETNIPAHYVVFSFDDGLNVDGTSTLALLDALDKYSVKAVFCMLGVNAEHSPSLAREVARRGHIIANHGYGGKWAIHLNAAKFRANLDNGNAAIVKAAGLQTGTKLYRPHGGFFTGKQKQMWTAEGYTLLPATIRLYDAVLSAKNSDRVYQDTLKKIHKADGGLVMLHCTRDSWQQEQAALAKHPKGVYNRSWIPPLVERLIVELKKEGYILNGFDLQALLGVR
jgi:peptidoglycan/xylan/chitin deacetylase (PgdA/CDA1 family)